MTPARWNFSRGRLIAHAGGAIGGLKYSNSIEAFEASARSVALIEMDVVQAADGLIVAHDGLEHTYGLKGAFNEVSCATFQTLKFKKSLSTMTLEDLFDRLQGKSCSVVLDIKTDSPETYAPVVADVVQLAQRKNVLGQVIVQCYSESDLENLKRFGGPNAILALWKYHPSIKSEDCRNCLAFFHNDISFDFQALSVAARHIWKDGVFKGEDVMSRIFENSREMFLHGQQEAGELPLLKMGFGLYSHNATAFMESEAAL